MSTATYLSFDVVLTRIKRLLEQALVPHDQGHLARAIRDAVALAAAAQPPGDPPPSAETGHIGTLTRRIRATGDLVADEPDSSLDAVVVMDATTGIQGVNPAAERILGCQADDLIGRDFADLIASVPRREGLRAALASILDARLGHPVAKHLTLTVCRVDGTTVPIELVLTCSRTAYQLLVVAYMRAISE